jgi:hypothetical protein
MLSLPQLQHVCLIYGDTAGNMAKKCRYLKEDQTNWQKFHCLKLKPVEKAKIDAKLAQVLADFKKQGLNPATQTVPQGDNCAGYPVLKNIQQGYDQP